VTNKNDKSIRKGFVLKSSIAFEMNSSRQYIEFSKANDTLSFEPCIVHAERWKNMTMKSKVPCLSETNSKITITNIDKHSIKVLRIILDTWDCNDSGVIYLKYCKDHKVW